MAMKMHFMADTRSVCPLKGTAHYYNIETGGKVNKDTAWYSPEPKPEAGSIKNHNAFWNGVQVK